jgi:hypothetical protein
MARGHGTRSRWLDSYLVPCWPGPLPRPECRVNLGASQIDRPSLRELRSEAAERESQDCFRWRGMEALKPRSLILAQLSEPIRTVLGHSLLPRWTTWFVLQPDTFFIHRRPFPRG